jgi:hypothetical protein
MGRFDRRKSQKSRRSRGQTKKKERLHRKAEQVRAARQGAKKKKK